MAEALVAGVGAAVDAGLKLNEQLMARKGGESARSCGIIFRNLSTTKLYLGGKGLSHGIWTDAAPAPTEINPGTEVAFMSESQGVLTGTQGWINYNFDQFGDWVVNFNWDIPYGHADNKFESRLNNRSDFKINHNGSQGANSTLIVNFNAVDAAGQFKADAEEKGEDKGVEGKEDEGGQEEGGGGGEGGDEEEKNEEEE